MKSKAIPLSAGAQQAIERQLDAFRKKFGRNPRPEDPIFFDPDADDPVPITQEKYDEAMVEAMTTAGLDPVLMYAYKRTGRLVTESNRHLLTREELREWNDAVDEYHRKLKPGDIV